MSILNPKKELLTELKVIELLKRANLSITAPRKNILSLLLKEHGPFTVEDIIRRLPKNSCDQATVYRCLNQFVESSLVATTFLEKDIARFEFNDPEHHHHHIICKICKKIESLHDCLIDKIEQGLKKKGYQDIEHRLEFFGICAQCTKP
ncbi:MAG: transcriptional repressor [Bacteriovoracaceae bacterium]|nr:transcriptional repressor [Bacteriovoracaceae bacterium]